MKQITLFLLTLCTFQTLIASPELVKVRIQKAYIAVGFDNNDQSEVYVTGYLPDGCHQFGPHRVTVDEKTQTVFIEQQAYKHPGPCIDMIIPYAHVVRLGVMGRGSYRIVDSTSSKELGALTVTEATKPIIDDFLYLPLTNAYAKQEGEKAEASITLQGTFVDRCTRYKETKVHYYQDVIVVQPIAERLPARLCTEEPKRFQLSVPLKADLKGSYLIHVRAMSGEAINSLFTFGS